LLTNLFDLSAGLKTQGTPREDIFNLPGNGKLKGCLVQSRYPVLHNTLASRFKLRVLRDFAVQQI